MKGRVLFGPYFFIALHLTAVALVLVRVMIRPHRDPASRIAWVVVVVSIPGFGILLYLLLGEVNIGRRRVERLKKVMADIPQLAEPVPEDRDNFQSEIPQLYEQLFHVGTSISGFEAVGGNTARLMEDSNATIESMVQDIANATDHVHILFYIWLTDHNGCKIIEALKSAASRGVNCRAMVDNLGSRTLIESEHWKAMQEVGVKVSIALPIGNPFLRILTGRIDLRNHRKIVVIDNKITYCGSQNCADPEFLVKAKFAPWVDAVMRFEGPVVRQNQHIFASDWMTYTNEDISDLLKPPIPTPNPGFSAQVVATGPTARYSAMPEMFESLIYAARQKLTITTPYYVPDESMQNAICSASYRGVETTIVFPARNDSWIVGGASRSYYYDLLKAGVKVYEYSGGLLHTKSLTIDGHITLIGSANMDRRSFDLNYENNILFCDEYQTEAVRNRQEQYIQSSTLVSLEEVKAWPIHLRLWNNTLALLGPVL